MKPLIISNIGTPQVPYKADRVLKALIKHGLAEDRAKLREQQIGLILDRIRPRLITTGALDSIYDLLESSQADWVDVVDPTLADKAAQVVATSVDNALGEFKKGDAIAIEVEEQPDGPTPSDYPPPSLYGEEIPETEDFITFWVNAFIPKDVAGAKPLPGGGADEFIMPGPIPWVSDCFLTDNRSFSADPGASVRLQSLAVFDVSKNIVTMAEAHRVGETKEYDCEDGDLDGVGLASNNDMRFFDLKGNSDHFSFRFEGAANNPRWPGSPDIDYRGTGIVLGRSFIRLIAIADRFPAYESYVKRGDKRTKTIFQRSPGSNQAGQLGPSIFPDEGPWGLSAFVAPQIIRKDANFA